MEHTSRNRSPKEKEILENLAASTISHDPDRLRKALDEALGLKIPLDEIVKEGIGKGMEIVGQRYESGEYFLSDLIISGLVMNEAMEQLKPLMKANATRTHGLILIGTVQGDLHDIGKNLAKYMLESAGIDVIDLGVDVFTHEFVRRTKEMNPDIVCMSALLSVTAPKVKETVDELKAAGLRDNLRILVGGRCLSEEKAREAGADAYGKDCFDGLRQAKRLLGTS